MRSSPSLAPWFAAGALFAAAAAAQSGSQMLWSNPWSNYAAVSSVVCTSPAIDVEAADDFDLQGTITRVVVDGHGCFQCLPPAVRGATVRFYTWNNGNPDALLHEVTVLAGSPALLFDATTPETIEVTLPAPFLATGRHFMSMQLLFQGGGTWEVWVSGTSNYRLSPLRVRNRLAGGAWTQGSIGGAPLFADLTFTLFGQAAGSGGPVSIACATWTELPTSSPPTAGYALLRAVKAFAADDVWAAGSWERAGIGQSDQFTLTAHWDGAAWTQVPSPSPSPAPGLTNCMLHGLDGVATDDLWAAGTFQTRVNGGWVGQQVFAMHWDGASWTVPPGLPLPNTSIGAGVTGSRIFDVEAEATDDVWFVGDWLDVVSASSGQTVRPGFLMHWDGSGLAQTVLPIVTGVAHQYFDSVSASGPDDVWVVGGAGVPGNLPGSPVPVLFHFDGANWTHTPCPTPQHPGWSVNLHHVDALSPFDAWVFGTSWTQLPTVQSDNFVAHWNGASWSLLPGAPPGSSAFAVTSAAEVWAVGIATWRFDGVAWTQTQAFTSQIGAGLGAVDTLGPCDAFAVGGQLRIGQVAPFAARLDAPWYARSQVRRPSQPARAPGTLWSLAAPRLGHGTAAAIDDPSRALGAPALTFWLLATAPVPGAAPVVVPFGGAGGGAGEVFVDVASMALLTPFVPWFPGAGAAVHSVAIPDLASLLGVDLFTQGVLCDAATLRLLFTNGLELHLGR